MNRRMSLTKCLLSVRLFRPYRSPYLFAVFFNMLSEGENRRIQSRLLHIDSSDDFGILLATAQNDTVGAITVKPIEP